MLTGLVLAMAIAADPIAAARDTFEGIETYTVTMRVTTPERKEVIDYSFRKPGFIRMDVVEPHSGVVLIYSPESKEVRLRPVPSWESFVLTLDPGNWLIRSSAGHTVDRSDLGSLIENLTELRENGGMTVHGMVEVEETGGEGVKVEVTGEDGYAVEGTHRYVLVLDPETYLPVKITAFGADGKKQEEVVMENLRLDPELPEGTFTMD